MLHTKTSSSTDLDGSDSENEDVAELCILPPDDGADSEVEAIDDDDLSPNEPSDVCGEVDVFTRHSDAENQVRTEKPEKRGAAQKSRKRKAPSSDANKQKKTKTAAGKVMWRKIDKFCDELPEVSPVPLADKHPEVIDKTPLELFEQIFDNDCFTYFKQQFELYASE